MVRLQDQFRQSTVYDSQNGLSYRIFKDALEFESYLNILEDKDLTTLADLEQQTIEIKQPVECGRWCNI
jgi:hypothetical protein